MKRRLCSCSTGGLDRDNFALRTKLALSELEPVGTCQVEPLAKFTDELGIPTVVVRLHQALSHAQVATVPFMENDKYSQ